MKWKKSYVTDAGPQLTVMFKLVSLFPCYSNYCVELYAGGSRGYGKPSWRVYEGRRALWETFL